MKAKNFTLPDQNGKMHSLSDYLGKWVILYFYPKDDTPGCTAEACSFRDYQNRLSPKNAVVIGISKDSISSHQKFATKYGLPFTLLADENHSVIDAYHSWGQKKIFGKAFEGTLRNSFLIDPEGNIFKEYLHVNPLTHVQDIIRDIP